MSSMSKRERALNYAERLQSARNKNEEAEKILKELNGLVWAKDNTSLPREDKLAILEETKSIIQEGLEIREGKILHKAADNSGILDVIDMLKPKVK
ncbi:hypothetical protein ES702_01897 [subsurface metagenome]